MGWGVHDTSELSPMEKKIIFMYAITGYQALVEFSEKGGKKQLLKRSKTDEYDYKVLFKVLQDELKYYAECTRY